MTTLTLHRSRPATERRIMVARTVRSEFTKVRSVRSTYWTLTLMVLASLAWCMAYCLGTVHHWPAMSPQDRANFDPPSPASSASPCSASSSSWCSAR